MAHGLVEMLGVICWMYPLWWIKTARQWWEQLLCVLRVTFPGSLSNLLQYLAAKWDPWSWLLCVHIQTKTNILLLLLFSVSQSWVNFQGCNIPFATEIQLNLTNSFRIHNWSAKVEIECRSLWFHICKLLLYSLMLYSLALCFYFLKLQFDTALCVSHHNLSQTCSVMHVRCCSGNDLSKAWAYHTNVNSLSLQKHW